MCLCSIDPSVIHKEYYGDGGVLEKRGAYEGPTKKRSIKSSSFILKKMLRNAQTSEQRVDSVRLFISRRISYSQSSSLGPLTREKPCVSKEIRLLTLLLSKNSSVRTPDVRDGDATRSGANTSYDRNPAIALYYWKVARTAGRKTHTSTFRRVCSGETCIATMVAKSCKQSCQPVLF